MWCQLVKGHIEREIIDWRRSRLTHVPDIRFGVRLSCLLSIGWSEGLDINLLTYVQIGMRKGNSFVDFFYYFLGHLEILILS